MENSNWMKHTASAVAGLVVGLLAQQAQLGARVDRIESKLEILLDRQEQQRQWERDREAKK